jgi:N-acyl-phosphatidylethanolamine-hydrolysing phospholipase D
LQEGSGGDDSRQLHRVYFAGDTGYRTVTKPGLSHAEEAAFPHCPAFAEIGDLFGPFDLALLPIGLCQPRHFISGVHCDPYDSICVHKDVKSKKSIGMHWGTVRGGISQEYEDVRDPPKWWREAAETAGLKWGEEIGLLDVGETLALN